MYKVAVIGRRSDVLGFMALGYSVAEADRPDAARDALHRLARSGQYAVIFITEDLCPSLEADIAKYSDDLIPSIVPIPSAGCDNGYGMAIIRAEVERAVGADVV